MKICSIDFNYFLNVDNDTRSKLFPNDPHRKGMDFENAYKKWGNKSGVPLKDLDILKNILKNNKSKEVIIINQHKDLLSYLPIVFSLGSDKKCIEITHIDNFHDCYPQEGVNSNNWLDLIKNKVEVKWYHNTWSDISSSLHPEGVPFHQSIYKEGEFDNVDFDVVILNRNILDVPPANLEYLTNLVNILLEEE